MLKSARRRAYALLGCILPAVGCSSDCLVYPCPLSLAIELTITTSDTRKPPAGLTVGFGNNASPSTSCDSSGLCRLLGGVGTYQVVVGAPGYATQQIEVNVTGDSPGCNTCGHVDVQRRDITLTPS